MIYEVTVTLPASAKEAALKYMREKHIPEVLKHPAFSKAVFYIEHDPAPQKFSFSTHYYFEELLALDNYMKGYALEMRADVTREFGALNPEITRRILYAGQQIDKNA